MKNKKALRLLFLANGVSGFAQGISLIAIPQYFIHVLHHRQDYNHLFLLVTVVLLLWGPYSGALIDRYNRKWLFFTLSCAGALVLGSASASGFAQGEVPVYMLGLVFVFSLLYNHIYYPTLYAFTHEITEVHDYARVNARLEIQIQAITMLSGAAAAFVLTGFTWENVVAVRPWSMRFVFMIDAISYLIGALLIACIQFVAVKKENIDHSGVWNRIKNGLVYLRQHKAILIFGLCSCVIFSVQTVYVFYGMQVYAYEKLQTTTTVVSLSQAGYAVGALFSGVLTRRLIGHMHKVDVVSVFIILGVLLYMGMVFLPAEFMYLLAAVCFGMVNVGVRIARNTWLFERVPNRMMGRAGSVFNNFNVLLRLVLILLAGAGMGALDISYTFVLLAATVFVSLVPLLAYRSRFIDAGDEDINT